MDNLYSRGGNLNSAIPNASTINPAEVKPINTTLWGNINRGGRATSAIPKLTPQVVKGASGFLGKLATGLKIATGPIGAGLAAAGKILAPKPLLEGEDDKLRKLGILPPLPNQKANVAPWVAHPEDWSQVNSVTPMPPPDNRGSMLVDGNRINYGDIGNPLKDAALINSKGYSFGVMPSENISESTQGATNLTNILKTIQSVEPIQNYANRVNALNTGNTTWDMDSLNKLLAARAGQQADTERYTHQVGALANLGSAQMNAEAAKAGHMFQLQAERERNAYMAPYYSALGKEAGAKAESAPLTAKADVLKVLNEQAKDDPVLKASLDVMTDFAKKGDAKGYNAYAAKLAILTGKLIPKMPVED